MLTVQGNSHPLIWGGYKNQINAINAILQWKKSNNYYACNYVLIPILKYLSSKKSKEKAINPTLQLTSNLGQPFVKDAAFSAFSSCVLLLQTYLIEHLRPLKISFI